MFFNNKRSLLFNRDRKLAHNKRPFSGFEKIRTDRFCFVDIKLIMESSKDTGELTVSPMWERIRYCIFELKSANDLKLCLFGPEKLREMLKDVCSAYFSVSIRSDFDFIVSRLEIFPKSFMALSDNYESSYFTGNGLFRATHPSITRYSDSFELFSLLNEMVNENRP